MTLEYIRKAYGVPAYRGAKILFGGSNGGVELQITSAVGQYLRAKDDDGRVYRLHPTWNIEYLGKPACSPIRYDSTTKLLLCASGDCGICHNCSPSTNIQGS
jgi:hypothetical protein